MATEFTPNGYFSYGDLAALDEQTNMTWSFWIYADDFDGAYNFFSKGNAANQGWFFQLTVGGDLDLYVDDGSYSHNINLSATTWYHIVVTYDGNNTYSYVDGAAGDNGALAKGAMAATANNLDIGAYGGANGLDGRMADVVIWAGAALTSTEAAAVYAGARPKASSIVFWAPLWDATGRDIIGNVSPSVNGTITAVGFEGPGIAVPGFNHQPLYPGVFITPVYKVISETLELVENSVRIITYIKVISEELQLVENLVPITVQVKTIADTLELYDGDYGDREDPSGKIVDTAPAANGGAETEYTKKFPPFVYRPRYTYDGD